MGPLVKFLLHDLVLKVLLGVYKCWPSLSSSSVKPSILKPLPKVQGYFLPIAL